MARSAEDKVHTRERERCCSIYCTFIVVAQELPKSKQNTEICTIQHKVKANMLFHRNLMNTINMIVGPISVFSLCYDFKLPV